MNSPSITIYGIFQWLEQHNYKICHWSNEKDCYLPVSERRLHDKLTEAVTTESPPTEPLPPTRVWSEDASVEGTVVCPSCRSRLLESNPTSTFCPVCQEWFPNVQNQTE